MHKKASTERADGTGGFLSIQFPLIGEYGRSFDDQIKG